MDEHTRPTIARMRPIPAAAVGGDGTYLPRKYIPPRKKAWYPEPFQMWCILAAFIGSILGVGWAGASIRTAQMEAYQRSEEASRLAAHRSAEVAFVLRKEQERKEMDLLLRNQAAVQACAVDGNVPVIGHDFTVVCLSRVNVQWEYSMKDPLPWL